MNNVEIHWELTDACNLSCHHCITNSGPSNKTGLNLDQAKTAILKMKDAYVKSICFTGGEPFCFERLKELLQFALENGIQPQIITNGTLVTEEMLLFFETHKIHFGVSLESISEKNNDSIRGNGSYEKVVNLLQKASLTNCEYSLYFTLNSFSFSEVPEMIRFALNHGCRGIHINDITVDGRAKNNHYLLLSENKKNGVVEKLSQCSNEILNLPLEGPEPSCWSDATTLLMASNGDIYHCTEIKRLNKNNVIGNILTFDLRRWVEDNQMMDYTDYECCYHVYYNKYITYVHNSPISCFMITNESDICDIPSLNAAFDDIYTKYQMTCEHCVDPDCMGYIWLLEDEADKLSECGVDVIVINEKINFLFTFKNDKGDIDVSLIQPKCQYRCTDTNKCNIRDNRPLVCHMYPVSPESIGGSFVWGLHKECQFIRKLYAENRISDFLSDVKKVLSRISFSLREEIYFMYTELDCLTKFPDGENDYIAICEM